MFNIWYLSPTARPLLMTGPLTLLFMFCYHKTEHLPIILNNLFVNNSDMHHYKTRNASNLHKNIEEQIMSIILLLVKVLIFGICSTLI
jgi:hypothetical protein